MDAGLIDWRIFFAVPCIVFAHPFSLFPSRNQDSGSQSMTGSTYFASPLRLLPWEAFF